MTNKIKDDPRIDKRLKAVFGDMPVDSVMNSSAKTREKILEEQNSEAAQQGKDVMQMINNSPHYKEAVPEEGLVTTTKEFTSQPDGNTIKIQYIRPDSDETLPCIYYIHGGGMMLSSCFDELYAAWGRCIARQGVAVAMVDFRNCMWASSAPEVAPFPAGLNDCVSGIKWVHENSDDLNIDKEQIVIAGESGGGNLTLATGLKLNQDGDIGIIKGLYALCPYIAGYWPLPENPSSEDNEGILLTLHSIFLGIKFDNDLYKLFRRVVMLAFIIFEVVAQTYLVMTYYSFKNDLLKFINQNFLKMKLILVLILVLVALISIPIVTMPGNKFLKHALEWDYFVGVISFYLLTFFMWKNKN